MKTIRFYQNKWSRGKINISSKVICRLILLVLSSLNHCTVIEYHLYFRHVKISVKEKKKPYCHQEAYDINIYIDI